MNKKVKLLKDSGFGYLVELAREIQLQYKENRNFATDKPIYCVYRKERFAAPEGRSVPQIINEDMQLEYGFRGEWYECEGEANTALIEYYEIDINDEKEIEYVFHNEVEIIETQMYASFETCFFTEKAAKEWMSRNKKTWRSFPIRSQFIKWYK